jgi:hypothetical protein
MAKSGVCAKCGKPWLGKGSKCNTCKSQERRERAEGLNPPSPPAEAPHKLTGITGTICKGKPVGKGTEFTLRAELDHAHYHKYSCTPTKEQAKRSMKEWTSPEPGFIPTKEDHSTWLARRLKETGAGSKVVRYGLDASGGIEIPIRHTDDDIDQAIHFIKALAS